VVYQSVFMGAFIKEDFYLNYIRSMCSILLQYMGCYREQQEGSC
jgi:hypothetical protein